MKIVLCRSIRVRCAHVVGKMGFPKRRVAEHAVAVWASERLRAGLDARAELLCDAAAGGPLLGMPKVVGARLARVCEELGLIRLDRGRIVQMTPEGERVAREQEPRVFVPELGTWAVFWVEDPLVAQPLLRVEPWKEPSAHEEEQEQRRERRERVSKGSAPKRSIQGTPSALLSLCDKDGLRPPIELLGGRGGAPIRLLELENKAEVVTTAETLTVELSLSPGEPAAAARIRGNAGEGRVDKRLPGPLGWSHAKVWRALLSTNGADTWWNDRSGALQCAFKDLADDARERFERCLRFKAPEIQGLGRFDDVAVESVPIEPATPADAQRWFEWLLARGAERPQWPDVYERRAAELQRRFQGFSVRAPAQGEFARTMRGEARPGPAYWHTQAPLDLGGGVS